MVKPVQIFAASVVALALSACAGVHSMVMTQPVRIGELKPVTQHPVTVSSKEQTPEALSLNEQWKKMAAEELQSLLVSKNIASSSNGQATVECSIDVVYGNRALRYWVGFGAGSGHIHVTIELKDNSGTVRYATKSDADLSVGVFGGDMSGAVRKTIRAAVKEFGSRL